MGDSIGRMQVELDANTAAHDAKLNAAAATATATSRNIAKSAREAAAAEQLYAKVGGDAVEEKTLRIIAAQAELRESTLLYKAAQKTVAAGNLNEEQSAQALGAVLQRLTASKLALAAASEVEARAQGHAISERMAASAAVRGLETGNVGIRSVENFLTTIPGVGAALTAIFPVLGAAAFAGILVDMGVKLYDVGKKASQAGTETAQAFTEMHEKAQVSNDDLAIQNDKLGDEIAKLSGRPGNGLLTALDQSRKMADQLLVSLQGDRKELEALLQEHNVSYFGEFMSGVAQTGAQAKQLMADQKALTESVRQANREYESAVVADGSAASIKKAGDKRNAAVQQAYRSQIGTLQVEAGRLRQEEQDSVGVASDSGSGGGSELKDNSAKISNVQGRIQQLQDQMTREQLIASIAAREVTVGGLKQKKEDTASANKVDEERLHGMESRLAELKIAGNVTKAYELEYWRERAGSFRRGSEEYRAIVTKEATLTEEISRAAHEGIEKQKARSKTQDAELATEAERIPSDPFGKERRDAQRASLESQDASNEANAQQAKNQAALATLSVQQATGRTLTVIAAATEMAAIHTREYGAELDRLQRQLASTKANPGLFGNEAEYQKRIDELQKQLNQTTANRGVQVLQDQFAMSLPDSSAVTGAKDALSEFTRASLDAASQMKNLVGGTLNDVNKTLVEELTSRSRTGPRNLWHSVGKDFATRATGSLLNRGEGSLLNMFGLGGTKQPTGKAGDPLHVIMEGLGFGSGAAGVIKGLGDAGLPGGKDASGSGIPSQLAGMFGLGSSKPDGSAGDPVHVVSGGGGASSILGGLSKAGGSGDDGDGGGMSDVVGLLSGFLPGFATGVSGFGGGPAIVGEKGPEVVNLPGGSSVIPNNRLGGMGGGGDIHIDARGATDPAQTEAAVHRAMKSWAPQIVAAASMGQRDQDYRRPSNARR